jgi:hypothetical protein
MRIVTDPSAMPLLSMKARVAAPAVKPLLCTHSLTPVGLFEYIVT